MAVLAVSCPEEVKLAHLVKDGSHDELASRAFQHKAEANQQITSSSLKAYPIQS
jgi:hypothetical protein